MELYYCACPRGLKWQTLVTFSQFSTLQKQSLLSRVPQVGLCSSICCADVGHLFSVHQGLFLWHHCKGCSLIPVATLGVMYSIYKLPVCIREVCNALDG